MLACPSVGCATHSYCSEYDRSNLKSCLVYTLAWLKFKRERINICVFYSYMHYSFTECYGGELNSCLAYTMVCGGQSWAISCFVVQSVYTKV